MPRRVLESDMVMLTLSLVGGLAVAPYLVRGARGSAKKGLGPTQKRLIYLSKMLPSDPEAVIRTQDLVIAVLRGHGSLPGLDAPRVQLQSDIRDPGVQSVAGWSPGLGGTPESTLHDYVALTNAMIEQNVHFGQMNGSERAVTLNRSRYDKLIPWLAMQIRALLQQARRGELEAPANARARGHWTGGVEPSDEEAEVLRRLNLMRGHLGNVADWVEATNPLLTGGRTPAGRKITPLTWNQARHRASRWHNALEAVTPAQMTEGTVVYRGSDGWTVQRLDKRVCLLEEGKSLAHCVKGGGYWTSVERGDIQIFSLRQPNGAPVVTFEVQPVQLSDVSYGDSMPARFRVMQAKGKRNRLLGTKKSQLVVECLHTRAWLEELLGRPVRPGDVGHDLIECQQILLRITGWDRIDVVDAGETPDPMPTQAEYNKAMKQIAGRRGGGNRRRSFGSPSMKRPAPIFPVQRARQAHQFIAQSLERVATAAEAGGEVPVAQRQRLAAGVHRALLVLDGYLVGRPASQSTSRHLSEAARRVLVDYDADEAVYLSDDGYSRLMLNLVRMDSAHPWVYVASVSLPETKARWATLTGTEG